MRLRMKKRHVAETSAPRCAYTESQPIPIQRHIAAGDGRCRVQRGHHAVARCAQTAGCRWVGCCSVASCSAEGSHARSVDSQKAPRLPSWMAHIQSPPGQALLALSLLLGLAAPFAPVAAAQPGSPLPPPLPAPNRVALSGILPDRPRLCRRLRSLLSPNPAPEQPRRLLFRRPPCPAGRLHLPRRGLQRSGSLPRRWAAIPMAPI